MGLSVNYEVFRKVDNEYKPMEFYLDNGEPYIDIFPGYDHMLNQVLTGCNRHGYDMEPLGDRRGLPEWYENAALESYRANGWLAEDEEMFKVNEDTYYDFLELVGWSANPEFSFVDWDDEFNNSAEVLTDDCFDESKAHKRNPLKDFVANVRMLMDAYGIWYPKPGEVIIVCRPSY